MSYWAYRDLKEDRLTFKNKNIEEQYKYGYCTLKSKNIRPNAILFKFDGENEPVDDNIYDTRITLADGRTEVLHDAHTINIVQLPEDMDFENIEPDNLLGKWLLSDYITNHELGDYIKDEEEVRGFLIHAREGYFLILEDSFNAYWLTYFNLGRPNNGRQKVWFSVIQKPYGYIGKYIIWAKRMWRSGEYEKTSDSN